MQVVKTKGGVGSDGRLKLDVPVEAPPAPSNSSWWWCSPQPNGSKYDFTGVVGRPNGRATPGRAEKTA